MLIQETYICKNGHILIHSYSDSGFKIRQIESGLLYEDVYDEPNKYTYEETDIPIDEVVNIG